MNSRSSSPRFKFISIRLKLLVSFTVLFSGVFAIAFYWFYNFSTQRAMKRVFEDMNSTALGTATQVDVNSLLDLYYDGEAPKDPNKIYDDPRYKKQLLWFRTVHELEPRAWPYTFVIVNRQEIEKTDIIAMDPGDSLTLPPGERPSLLDPEAISQLPPDAPVSTVFLADLWVYYDASKAASFFEVSEASPEVLRAYQEGMPVDKPLYDDQQFNSSWISTYVPLKNDIGKTVAILGVDFKADYVRQVQNAIKQRILIVFILTYVSVFILVYFLSNIFSKPICRLSQVAKEIGEGDYEHDLSVFYKRRLPDEITILADVFIMMANKVRQREESLKKQVAQLKIEIDHSRREKEVKQITETDFFQDLRSKALRLRERRNLEDAEDIKAASPKNKGSSDSSALMSDFE